MSRATARLAAALGLAAASTVGLTACGLVDTGATGPTTTAGRPYVPTTSTTIGLAPDDTATSVAATTADGSPPSTVAVVVVANPTTAPAVVVGPPLNFVTLLESPAETRKQASATGIDGVLVKATNPGLSRSFVFGTYASQLDRVRPAPGWSFTVLSRDRQWTPASSSAVASVFVGRRWQVYLDAPAATGGGTAAGRDVQLVSFDVTTNAFASYLETPNKVTWFADDLQALDDHTVGILFDPDPTRLDVRTTLALRRVDLLNGRVSDERIVLPEGGSYSRPYLGADGSITLYGATTDQVLYRPAGGEFTVRPADGVRPPRLIDGFLLDWSSVGTDPENDVSLVDTQGNLMAKVHSWRFAANGPGIGYFGFADGRGYFGAFREQGVGGELNLGVFDTSTATWDWVFDPTSPLFAGGGMGFFVAGTA